MDLLLYGLLDLFCLDLLVCGLLLGGGNNCVCCVFFVCLRSCLGLPLDFMIIGCNCAIVCLMLVLGFMFCVFGWFVNFAW